MRCVSAIRTSGSRPPATAFCCHRLIDFVCECCDGRSTEPIALTRAEYESVRATSNRFAIRLHHENPVDKIEGVALRIARDTDPRSDTHVPRDPRIGEGR